MRLPIATLLAVACVSSCLLSDEDGDGTDYISITEIEQAYKDAQCTHFAACGIFPTKDACLQAQLTSSGAFEFNPNIEAAIYAGHIIYNGSNVKACLDAYAARSCDRTDQTVRSIPLECSSFFRGTLMAGEGCFVDEECISGFCSGDSGNSCQLGNCIGDTPPTIARAQIGETCQSLNSCVDGAYCDQLTSQCTAHKGSGVSCMQDSECAYGLGCVGMTGARTCGTLPAVGQACSTDGICRDEGTFCDFTADMCKPLGLPNAQCTSGSHCSQYYPCDFTTSPGVCTQGPGLGMPCSSSSRCFDAGTYCDFNSSMCAALKSEGESCNSSEECANGFCDFNGINPVCTTPMTCF